MNFNNISDLEPDRVVSYFQYVEESDQRFRPNEMYVGAEYHARIERSFDTRDFAGDYRVEIDKITAVKKRLVFPGVLVPCVKITMIPFSAEGKHLEDQADSRLVGMDGTVYSHGVRNQDGYFRSAVTDDIDFAVDSILGQLPTRPVELV